MSRRSEERSNDQTTDWNAHDNAARGVNVRALVRKPGESRLPAQIEVVRGDLTVPEALDLSLDGTEALFLVWTAPSAAVGPALERIVEHARSDGPMGAALWRDSFKPLTEIVMGQLLTLHYLQTQPPSMLQVSRWAASWRRYPASI